MRLRVERAIPAGSPARVLLAVGIPRHLKVYLSGVRSSGPLPGAAVSSAARPEILSMAAEDMLVMQWQNISWAPAQGKAQKPALQLSVCARRRTTQAGSGTRVSNICWDSLAHRRKPPFGREKYYLANCPAQDGLRNLPPSSSSMDL